MSARVFHADLWGVRETKDRQAGKYPWLLQHDITNTDWTELDPQSPFYLFKPQDTALNEEYQAGWSVREAMPVNSVGIVTARDKLTIHWTAAETLETVRDFAALDPEEARTKYGLGRDVQDWKVKFAQKDINEHGDKASRIIPVLYRPFDARFTYYTGRSRGFICRPRADVMHHMLAGENVGLITSRMTKGETFKHAQVTRKIVEVICMSPKTSNNGFLFPLYLYPRPDKPMGEISPWPEGKGGRRPNLNPEFVRDVEKRIGLGFVPDGRGDLNKTFGPEDVFHYIYAVFHSPTYRERYAGFLRIDFPRVPVTSDRGLFVRLCGLGLELTALHLMESPALDHLITNYPIPGDDAVEKGHPRYLAPGDPEPSTGKPLEVGRVYISKDMTKTGRRGQYFEGVPPEVWGFHVGGYRVCEKWLKDRRGRNLSHDDLTHYQKIVVALQHTIRLVTEMDQAIPSWPMT